MKIYFYELQSYPLSNLQYTLHNYYYVYPASPKVLCNSEYFRNYPPNRFFIASVEEIGLVSVKFIYILVIKNQLSTTANNA